MPRKVLGAELLYSEEAIKALGIAARDKDSIFDLEFLGIPTRALSILQKNGIETMDQLLQKTSKELAQIKNISEITVYKILVALSFYHELPRKRASAESVKV